MTNPAYLSVFGLKALRRTALVLVAVAAVLGGCSSEEVCEGIEINGECQAKCNPSACAIQGSQCFENACVAPCSTNDDCTPGTHCRGLSFDNGATTSNHCIVITEFAKQGKTGQYEACTDSQKDCDLERGFLCIDGECRLSCQTHTDCAKVGLCTPGKDTAGKTSLGCVKDETKQVLAGQFGTACPNDTDEECDTQNGFFCAGVGPGDLDNYCTKGGCQADSDCGAGFYCATSRTGRRPCEASNPCSFTSGGSECVKNADIGAGKEYSCGPVGLLRRVCQKRRFCSNCETDADCLAAPNQICAKDSGGVKRCTVTCDPNISGSCPWGNAASCKVWDKERGVPTCAHRAGACKGTGKSCDPCRDDGDCPGGLCLGSTFTGERYCASLDSSCSCDGLTVTQGVYCVGGGCPVSPGGVQTRCYGGSKVTSSPLYKKCLAGNSASTPGTQQTGCWLPE